LKKQLITLVLLLVYFFVLIEILVLKQLPVVRIGHMMFNFGGVQEGPSNFIPFKTLVPYLMGSNGFLIAAINIVGNIIALIPLGFLVPLTFPKMKLKKVLLLALFAGLSIEITQVVLHIGIFDIDDVLLNGIGVIIGFWLNRLYLKFSADIQKKIIWFFFIFTILVISFLTLSYYKKVKFPIGIESASDNMLMPALNNNSAINASNAVCCDLCKGTGGTGKIISIGEQSLNIVRKDGVTQTIKITKQTTIKTIEGVATNTALKVGNNITVVIDETETASLILVCKTTEQKK
jgi:glycopeptide antibiotics resistance protein